MNTTTQQYEIDIEDVEYIRHAGKPVLARVYTPRGSGPFPLAIEIHGGAWCRSDRLQDALIHEAVARSGIVVAALLSGLLLGQLAPWFQLVGLRTETLATIGFNPLPYLEALVALLVASGLFGVLPALRLRKTEPISLLREEAA